MIIYWEWPKTDCRVMPFYITQQFILDFCFLLPRLPSSRVLSSHVYRFLSYGYTTLEFHGMTNGCGLPFGKCAIHARGS